MADDRYLQDRLDELFEACEADPASVGRLYLEPSFRRLMRSLDAVRDAAAALGDSLASAPPPDAPPEDDEG